MIVFLLFLLFFLSVTCLLISSPSKIWTDSTTPLNFLLFQEPKVNYQVQFINTWVSKEWNLNADKIPCRIVNYPESDHLIIFSHSFEDNLLTVYPFMTLLSSMLHVSVVSYDYSGYGLNPFDSFERKGVGINATLSSVYNHFAKDFDSLKISLLGCSFGTGCSIKLASELGSNLESLILLSGFSSINDLVYDTWKSKFGCNMSNELSSMFSERWNNSKLISEIKVPTLLLHGKYDQIVSMKHAQKLKQANPNCVTLIELNSGHLSFNWEIAISHILNWGKES
jgi:pimeloyl-ACP methyl ester carboxylesterase